MSATRQTPALGAKVIPLRRPEERRLVTSELTDEALLAACSVGDNAALGALFDRHHEAVHRLLARLLRSEPGAIDDLVQTTFMEVWRSASKYNGTGAVRSWLFGIAANSVRHYVRGAKRRRDAHAAIPEPATRRGPDMQAMHAQQVGRLAAALEELPHDLRVAYVMCDLEGISGVDAARTLDVREGTLWRRLHDARKRLRAAVEGDDS